LITGYGNLRFFGGYIRYQMQAVILSGSLQKYYFL
jgi:hypothetical protein